MDKMRELTKAELQIMQVLWRKERAFVNEIREDMPEPRPAYNTISTVLRVLVEKEFVSYQNYGWFGEGGGFFFRPKREAVKCGDRRDYRYFE